VVPEVQIQALIRAQRRQPGLRAHGGRGNNGGQFGSLAVWQFGCYFITLWQFGNKAVWAVWGAMGHLAALYLRIFFCYFAGCDEE
jgi:hypothetical protein